MYSYMNENAWLARRVSVPRTLNKGFKVTQELPGIVSLPVWGVSMALGSRGHLEASPARSPICRPGHLNPNTTALEV